MATVVMSRRLVVPIRYGPIDYCPIHYCIDAVADSRSVPR